MAQDTDDINLTPQELQTLSELDSRQFGFLKLNSPEQTKKKALVIRAIKYLERMLVQAQAEKQRRKADNTKACLDDKENEDEAKGISIDPKTYCKLGHFHLLLEDYSKAMSAYQKFYSLKGDYWKDASFLYGLGLVYFHFNAFQCYLAHGDSAATTAWHFRVGKSTMYSIIPEVCKAIWDVLQPLYLRCPNEENEWLQIANDFNSLWNFPNCIGAIDGKHIRIKAPPRSGSAFYNYKGSFSIVLMAICDAHYRFTWLDIGDYGSLNDAGIWSNTEMSTALENNTVSLPPELYLPHTNIAVPFALVGDEGFPLKKLSRARRIIENAFGILVARWQIFQGSICFKLETVEAIVQATCCLHNFIISTNYLNNRYIQEDFIDREGPNGELIEGVWRSSIQHSAINRVGRVGANIGSVAAMRQRDILAQYFVSDDGSIPWQWEMI
ncbi:uncharacterized protein [Temnothorax nylanderi]|uniref:uncharacterized protein isoform X2 n=1 Tax=Temnothorax nylanderi TaxID=102681 RepID=UPI003A88AD0C